MTGSLSISVTRVKKSRANVLRPARAERRKVGHDTQTDPSVSLPMTTQHSSA
jgi:hypothetical protein